MFSAHCKLLQIYDRRKDYSDINNCDITKEIVSYPHYYHFIDTLLREIY